MQLNRDSFYVGATPGDCIGHVSVIFLATVKEFYAFA